jgi:ATP-dependent DNA helicase RecQ
MSGIGALKLERYGEIFLEVLHSHAAEYGLPDDLPPLPHRAAPAAPPKPKTEGLSETASTTLDLFRRGMTVEEIATTRELKPSTIYIHLSAAIEEGKLGLREVVTLREDEIQKIKDTILRLPKEEQKFLRPVFEAFEGAYDYNILRCVAADMARKKR